MNSISINQTPNKVSQKIADYSQLFKLRLTSLVVFSAATGYAIAAGAAIDFRSLLLLSVGGFLIVGASNGLNQILERNTDLLMVRTANRPVATGRMGVLEASIVAFISGLLGIVVLGVFLNALSAWLGFAAMISYAFIYTPFKKISPVSVFIGAFPGALPVLIGYTAYAGSITIEGGFLFLIQFIWQFPHFWAIAWILNEDYNKAGFKMLPSEHQPGLRTAWQILIYTLSLFPICFLFWQFGFIGNITFVILLLLTLAFSIPCVKLTRSTSQDDAKLVMFGSFLYLPFVQIALVIDKF